MDIDKAREILNSDLDRIRNKKCIAEGINNYMNI